MLYGVGAYVRIESQRGRSSEDLTYSVVKSVWIEHHLPVLNFNLSFDFRDTCWRNMKSKQSRYFGEVTFCQSFFEMYSTL